jgi:polyketide synthase-like dehydratase family protein
LKIQIDPAVDTFLPDHVVDGSPVLPTVMQLDLVARGLLAGTAEQPAGVLMRGIRVGPPVRFSRPGPRQLDIACTPEPSASPERPALRCELRSPGCDASHLVAVAESVPGPAPRMPARGESSGDLPCGPDLVYPPFFHGPTFQVVAAFGRTRTGLGASLAAGLPPLSWGRESTVLQPRLLELLLQCCGIYEMASTGRMMVPAGIEAVHWHTGALGAGHAGSAMAVIKVRPARPDRGRVFDGQVVTASGTVLVTVTGYQVTDVGHVADPATATRLTRRLDAQPVRSAPTSRNSHPEGALR